MNLEMRIKRSFVLKKNKRKTKRKQITWMVYAIVDRETDEVAYVGHTKNPDTRFASHIQGSGRFPGKYYYCEALAWNILSEKKARLLEKRYIEIYQDTCCNITHNLRRKS